VKLLSENRPADVKLHWQEGSHAVDDKGVRIDVGIKGRHAQGPNGVVTLA